MGIDTLSTTTIDTNDPINDTLINTDSVTISLTNVNYLQCLEEWQDSVANCLTSQAFYGKVHNQSRGHLLVENSDENVSRLQLCIDNIEEECDLLIDELVEKDFIEPEKVMKELCDLLYVVFGFASRYKELKYLDEAFTRVHKNNMVKLKKGTVRSDGKLVKPVGHLPPVLADLIEKGVNDGN